MRRIAANAFSLGSRYAAKKHAKSHVMYNSRVPPAAWSQTLALLYVNLGMKPLLFLLVPCSLLRLLRLRLARSREDWNRGNLLKASHRPLLARLPSLACLLIHE